MRSSPSRKHRFPAQMHTHKRQGEASGNAPTLALSRALQPKHNSMTKAALCKRGPAPNIWFQFRCLHQATLPTKTPACRVRPFCAWHTHKRHVRRFHDRATVARPLPCSARVRRMAHCLPPTGTDMHPQTALTVVHAPLPCPDASARRYCGNPRLSLSRAGCDCTANPCHKGIAVRGGLQPTGKDAQPSSHQAHGPHNTP